ncbi:hypothetical protein XELAEV_18015915mg, partial [Xenopus laevis]
VKLDTLNSNDFNIKLTSSVSKSSVNFLDLTIPVDSNKRITSLYRKPTHTNGFILRSSCHHKKWLNNIPLSQFNRVKRNCSKKEDYDKECQILRKQFREKGYSEKIVEEAKIKCDQKDRREMLKNTAKRKYNNNDSIPFITTYNCSKNKFEKILQKHWHILKKDKDLTNVIYLLQCPCNLQYIGRTGRCLKTRIGEHMNNIKKGILTHSVSAYFKSHHNSDPSLLTFAGIIHKRTHWRGSDIIKSISQEQTVWIHKLKTLAPRGLNIDIDLKCFLID